MRIAYIGGGPAGLYAALLLKKQNPHFDVTVFERNSADDTFGWGVVFSDQTRENLTRADPDTHRMICDSFHHWDDIEVHFQGRVIRSGGHGFSGIGRMRLLDRGQVVALSGMIGWNPVEQRFETNDFIGQVEQALKNILTVLKEAGAGPQHIVRLTWFVTSRDEYLANQSKLGQAYRSVMGTHFPAMSVVVVSGLVEEAAKLEIEATAIIPD